MFGQEYICCFWFRLIPLSSLYNKYKATANSKHLAKYEIVNGETTSLAPSEGYKIHLPPISASKSHLIPGFNLFCWVSI